MQTFNALPPASHLASAQPAATAATAEKPPQAGGGFGDVIDRAISGAKQQGNQSKGDKPVKKPGQPEKSPDALLTALNEIKNEKDTTSNQVSADKDTPAPTSKDSDDISKAISAQFLPMLAVANPLAAVPAPAPTAGAANKGQNTPKASAHVLSPTIAHTETSSSGPKTLETSTWPSNSAELPETGSRPSQTKADSANIPSAQSKEPSIHSEAPSSKDNALPQHLGLQPVQAETEKTAPADPTAPPVSTPKPELPQAQTADSKASAEIATPSPTLGGTSVAKQQMTMQKAEKMQKVAGPGEQDLPGNPTASGEELPTGEKLSVKAPSHANEKLESAVTVQSPATIRIASAEPAAPAAATATASPVAGIDTRVLERTHDIVSLHAMRLSESNSQSLHVIVKPGAGIQLSLELRRGDNGIDVHASLHKGNFEFLNQHWPELQQRLEARGVRVGTLTTSENYSQTGQQHFHQSKQQNSQHDPLHAGAFAEFALAGSMAEAPAVRAARASAYRGWETWA